MEIRYEKTRCNLLITDCPNKQVRYIDDEIYIIKVCSKSCKGCQHFDGYQNSKQIVFCKYGEKENE